jgi:hypothetical protein
MASAIWLGTEKPQNSVENEPLSENFFTNTDVLTSQSILVRESVQNAIDAKLPGSPGPVRMVFKLGTAPELTATKYFSGIFPRIKASVGDRLLPKSGDECHYLLIEDFNTTGLLGETSSSKPSGPGKENSFWYFTWATGTSNKGDGTRGKNGVGKIVFPRSSRIKSQLVYSVRRHQNALSTMVFGTSLLKMHDLDGKRWEPECRWMRETASGEHVPFDAEKEAVAFAADWGVKRSPTETGTSILVPYVTEGFSASKLTQCIIQDYFVAILDGTIECKVLDYNGAEVEIKASTIEDLLGDLDEDLLTKSSKSKEELRALCKQYTNKLQGKALTITLAAPSGGSSNSWGAFAVSDDEKIQIQTALDNGDTVEFLVPALVPALLESKEPRAWDNFSVLISRENDMSVSPTFAREGILIPAAAYGTSKFRDLLPLVAISEGYLADCLGQAEGPSHEKWSAEEGKFRDKYVKSHGIELIRFLRDSVSRVVKLFQGQDNEPENSHYSKWFPDSDGSGRGVSAESEGKLPKAKRRKGNGSGGVVATGFDIEKTDSGFRVVPSSEDQAKPGTKVLLKVGYAQFRGGSPLAKSAEDFELKNHNPVDKGLKWLSFDENHVTFTVENKDFSIEFSNFDKYRDLVIGVVNAG